MTARIDVHTLARMANAFTAEAANVESAAAALPRMFATDDAARAFDIAFDSLRSDVRRGVATLLDTPYGPAIQAASAAVDDAAIGIGQLRALRRGNVRPHAQALVTAIDTLTSELTSTHRSVLADRLEAGAAETAAVRQEAIRAIDDVLDGRPMAGSVALLLDLESVGRRGTRMPTIDVTDELAVLLERAPKHSDAALDLHRQLSAWRADLAGDVLDGSSLASRTHALVARGADDMTREDWRTLYALLDEDPLGRHTRIPSWLATSDQPVRQLIHDAATGADVPRQQFAKHLLVELADLELTGATTSTSRLRDEARRILGRPNETYSERDWARLAAIGQADRTYRVLPPTPAEGSGVLRGEDQLRPLWELTRADRTYPDGMRLAAEVLDGWRAHLGGPANELRRRIADRSFEAARRVDGALGAEADHVIARRPHLADPEQTTVLQEVELLGRSVGRLVGGRIRTRLQSAAEAAASSLGHGAHASHARGSHLDAVLAGGPIPADLTLERLMQQPSWSTASELQRTATAARLLARHEPTTIETAQAFIDDARRVTIDDELVSRDLVRTWRQAEGELRHQDDILAGRVRNAGYQRHPDYARLGRVRSTFEALAVDLGIQARTEADEAAAAAAAAATPAPARPAPTVAGEDVATGTFELVEAAPASTTDELLTW